MDSDLKEFEEELSRLAPEAMPDGLISRMEAAMDGWQDAEKEEKVVPFPQKEFEKSRSGLWRTAAAVAILGASAALLVPSGGSAPNKEVALTSSLPAASMTPKQVAPVSFEPHSAQRNVVSANNEGMVVMRDETPHLCVRFQYMDRFEFKGPDGRSLQVRKPAVRYVLIPVRAD